MLKYGFEQKSFQSKKTNFVFFIFLIMVVFVWALIISPDHGGLAANNINTELRIDFVNVGQGDAILIRTPKGKNYLIDAGTNATISDARREGRELMQNYLRNNKIARLDGLVVTHWHNDHLGGIIPILRLFEIDQIWETMSSHETETFKEYESIASRKRLKRTSAKAGDVLDWGNELFVQVLHPERPISSQEYSDVNNMSIVLLIRYGEVQMLLAGDIEEDSERELMRYGEAISSQILKVPHHGSDTSDYMPFLQRVSPEVGVMMIGKNNPFKHPSMRTLDHYQRIGTKLYRTDRHGNIRLFVGGKDESDYRFEVDQNF